MGLVHRVTHAGVDTILFLALPDQLVDTTRGLLFDQLLKSVRLSTAAVCRHCGKDCANPSTSLGLVHTMLDQPLLRCELSLVEVAHHAAHDLHPLEFLLLVDGDASAEGIENRLREVHLRHHKCGTLSSSHCRKGHSHSALCRWDDRFLEGVVGQRCDDGEDLLLRSEGQLLQDLVHLLGEDSDDDAFDSFHYLLVASGNGDQVWELFLQCLSLSGTTRRDDELWLRTLHLAKTTDHGGADGADTDQTDAFRHSRHGSEKRSRGNSGEVLD
mmetsp:Transcript_1500/g.2036  ORF Transcript_1500/g.2036 Transcript_1500/m.2036 type:complete len:271 (-) Transcript_1500:16-828(-)